MQAKIGHPDSVSVWITESDAQRRAVLNDVAVFSGELLLIALYYLSTH
jgi:hypothetical protein